MGTQKAAKAVAALPLGDGISITLVQDEDGWRFFAWAAMSGPPYVQPPQEADLARRFPTEVAAAAYFRSVAPK